MANTKIELEAHMIHPGTEHWKALGRLIGYIKGKDNKCIFIRKPKVLKSVMFCDSNYSTDKETRNIVISLVTMIGGTLLKCSSRTKRTVTLNITEAE